MTIKGMIQLSGTTYRVVEIRTGFYQVIRIHDEAVAGTFSCAHSVRSSALSVDAALMRQIACAAVQQGRTSWMGAGASS